MNAARAQKYRYVPFAALCVFLLAAGFGVFWLIRNFISGEPPPQKKVAQEIHIIRPPPEELPPPPPPPPEEKVDIPDPPPEAQPDPTPSDEPPPSETLGLDADAGAGSDGFGLAARKGGRDLLASGGSAAKWYAGLLRDQVLESLQNDKRVRSGRGYSVQVRAWVRPDGTVDKIELAQSTGDGERDQAIRQVLSTISRMPQAPPADMPQPMVLRIVLRA